MIVATQFNHMFLLSIGDYSADGHGQSTDYFIGSTLSRDEFDESYKRIVTQTNIDPSKYCVYYEDYWFPEQLMNDLIAKGAKIEFDNDAVDEDSGIDLCGCADTFLSILLEFVRIHDDRFQYEVLLQDMKQSNLSGSGYGLFY